MRLLGVLLIILFFVIGITSEHLPKGCDARPFIGIAFLFFIIGISLLIMAKEFKFESEKYFFTPPPTPPRRKKGLITNESHNEKPNFPPDRLTRT